MTFELAEETGKGAPSRNGIGVGGYSRVGLRQGSNWAGRHSGQPRIEGPISFCCQLPLIISGGSPLA